MIKDLDEVEANTCYYVNRKNKEGYDDPTPYDALTKIALEKSKKAVVDGGMRSAEDEQFRKLLFTIFDICDLAGFRLEVRLKLINKESGKIYE